MEDLSQNSPGVVAAGSIEAVNSGEAILRQGGNAVDAAIAGVLTAFASEPVLTGPFGGGFAMVASPKAAAQSYQFFAQAPGIGGSPNDEVQDFLGLECTFGPATQTFHVGKGSVALPLMLPGLIKLHEDKGSLGWRSLIAPAAEIAQEGILLSEKMAGIFDVLTPILSLTPGVKALFAPGGKMLKAGERFSSPDLPMFLSQLGTGNLGETYGNLLSHFGSPAGLIQPGDLQGQTIISPPALEFPFGETIIHLNPPPTSGGLLIAFGLHLLTHVPKAVWKDQAETMRHFLAVMATTQKARLEYIDNELEKGGSDWLSRILTPDKISSYENHFNRLLHEGAPLNEMASNDLGHTTHISVLDRAGMACSITTSNGEGCGHIVPGSGCMANNFMGEEDLHPNGFHKLAPGTPLTSMMCPTIVTQNGRPIVALGSGGSNRIRTAILQVLVRHLLGGESIEEAVNAPRIHYEGGEITVERRGYEFELSPKTLDGLEKMGGKLTLFEEPNVYFGGVHAVGVGGHGAGDKRRSGIMKVVD